MFFKKRKRRTDSAVVPATAEQSQVVPQEVEYLNFEKPTRKEALEPQPAASKMVAKHWSRPSATKN